MCLGVVPGVPDLGDGTQGLTLGFSYSWGPSGLLRYFMSPKSFGAGSISIYSVRP